MRFSNQNLIFGATSLLSLVGPGHTASCTDNSILAPQTWGGKSGAPTNWCSTNWDKGVVVTGLELWATPWQVKGLRFTYSDTTKSNIFGKNTDDDGNVLPTSDSITWAVGDTIKSMTIGPNWVSPPDALGIFHMEVSNGQKIDYAGTYTGSPKPVDVGSGIMLGASGGAGAFIDGAQFMFLADTVGQAEITAIQFDEDLNTVNKKQEGIQAMNLDDMWFKNSDTTGPNKTYSFGGNEIMTQSKVLTQQNTNTFGTSVKTTISAEVEVPEVAKLSTSVEAGVSYEYSHMSSSALTDSTTHTLIYSQTGGIAPGRAVHCTATSEKGSFSSGYNSTVTVTLAGGQKFNINQRGQFDSIGYTDAFSECVDAPLTKAPSSAKEAVPKVVKATGTNSTVKARSFRA